MNQPLVSVVINNFNYGRFLGYAIDSALNQTYPHVEVIVVDDGSTDESPAVLERYQGRIDALRQENRGQAAAVNAGFARAHGDVVIFLDSDDELLPDIVEKIAVAYCNAPDVARVQYRLAVVRRDGTPTGALIPSADAGMPNGDVRRELARFNNYAWWPPMSGNAYSAKVLRRICPMPEEPFARGADYYLVRAATLCGPICSIDTVGAYYRMHGANVYLTARFELDVMREQIDLTNHAHERLREFAESIQFGGFPRRASDMWDLRFFALRVASLRLDPLKHPISGDRLLRVATRGANVAFLQTQRPMLFRCAAAAWFAAMVVSPRSLGWSLADWFFFPDNRPHALRLSSALSRVSA